MLDSVYDEVRASCAPRLLLPQGDELDQVRHTILINGALNAKIVGQSAHTIAALAGVNVPRRRKILIGEVESVELSEEFAHEKLSRCWRCTTRRTLTRRSTRPKARLRRRPRPHRVPVHPSGAKEKIMKHAERMEACRIIINTPSSFGGIGDLYNFKMAPSLTLGCGTWGRQLRLRKRRRDACSMSRPLPRRREHALVPRAREGVFQEGAACRWRSTRLGTVMGQEEMLHRHRYVPLQNGYVAPIEEKLDQLGIQHTCFYDVAPDPNLSSALKGAQAMCLFEPDCIIALGGGSAMDAGKIMWVMYEHPEVDFLDMAMRFMDIRKRVYLRRWAKRRISSRSRPLPARARR